jgi:type I restriction enzyme, R subunit
MALPATDFELGPRPTVTEAEQTHLPVMTLLAKMGYHCLRAEEAMALRGGKSTRLLLEDVLRSQLQRLNSIRFKGREHAFTAANIQRAIQALNDVPMAEGLQRASEQVYDLLVLGKSLEQAIDGDTKSFTLRYVDWEEPRNNVFHAAVQYPVRRERAQSDCRPDVVLFVNGIPFAVLECKAPGVELSEAVDQILRYQSAEYIPHLFKYVQLVLALKPSETKYGTAGTAARFWSAWRGGKDENPDPEIEALLSRPLPESEEEALLGWFLREERAYYRTEEEGRRVTEQDRALYFLCKPERLLELVGRFILYEGGEKKIARYQQYYAVKAAIRQILSPGEGTARPGGVIWHTQGSGKSLTMVLLANAIARCREIENPRIILVTDRIDLDKQLGTTFRRCGLEPRRATSGADLRRLVEGSRATVVTTLVQKFSAALAQGEVADASRDVFLLVDEGHRSHYNVMHQAVRKVFPNACYLAFTGTPLLRAEKNTFAKFGRLISSYTMHEAVADKAVVPLLYERRHVSQEVLGEPLDARFERLVPNATEAEKADLKRKFSGAQMLLRTEQRLWLIAFDLSGHFETHWKKEGRYKAQVVAPDKKSAILLHRYLKEIGKVTSEVIISHPEEKEGYEAPDERVADVVWEFWNGVMQVHKTEDRYNDDVIARFKSAEDPEVLIVVDKLITGFDVPRNTVLYLTRRLTGHSLLQAIARVNRIYQDKDFGYILDYVGVLGELDRALSEYKALAGFDPQDLLGMLANVRDEVAKLPARHAALLDLFRSVGRHDLEGHELALAEEGYRRDFYAALNAFSHTLRIALSTEFFHLETPADRVARYREDLRFFQKLRASAQLRYAERVEFRKLEPQIEKLLDIYVVSQEVESLTPDAINIFDEAEMMAALAKAMPRHSDAARADTIAHAMERTLTERMDEDPALYRKFSEMVRDTIEAFRQEKLRDEEYLRRIQELRSQFVTRTDSGLPPRLVGSEVAQAYYRVVMEQIERLTAPDDRESAAEIALLIDAAVRRHVVVDWQRKPDVWNRMRETMDDALYRLSEVGGIRLDWEALDEIALEVERIARTRMV